MADLAADSDVVGLGVRLAGAPDLVAAREAIRSAAWLGEPIATDGLPTGTRRFLTDLVLPLPPDGRRLSLRKAAYVDLGPAEVRDGGTCSATVAWRSASLAPLFPVFAGRLEVHPDGFSLKGRYAPPGGALGRAADRMLLHVAAHGTARWFLGRLADAASRAAVTRPA